MIQFVIFSAAVWLAIVVVVAHPNGSGVCETYISFEGVASAHGVILCLPDLLE